MDVNLCGAVKLMCRESRGLVYRIECVGEKQFDLSPGSLTNFISTALPWLSSGAFISIARLCSFGWVVLGVSLIEALLEELEKRPEAAKRLARRIAMDIVSEEQLRTLLLDAILRESATKKDLEKLWDRIDRRFAELEKRVDAKFAEMEKRVEALEKEVVELRSRVVALEKRMDSLEERMHRLEERMDRFYTDLNRRMDTLTRWMIGLLVTIWATLVAIGLTALRLLMH